VDYLDNLVPNISLAIGDVPTWNAEKPRFLNMVVGFASTHLQDDGVIFLFHANSSKLKMALKGFLMAIHFNTHNK
jgi:hypothetical protein